jgi:hypothetical protein
MNWLEILKPRLMTRDETRAVLGKDFYVYVLWRSDKMEPFYVGKGHNGRVLQHFCESESSNHFKTRIIAKTDVLISLTPAESEEAAHEREIALIAAIGRRDLDAGPLANLTDGGEGTSGHIGLRGGENPTARPVSVEGTVYGSVVEAGEANGISQALARARCLAGWPGWFFVDEGQRDPQKKITMSYRKPVVVADEQFDSLHAAAEAMGLSVGQVFKRIERGWPGYYRVEEGQRDRVSHNKAVRIDGVEYASQKIAAATLGLTATCLRARLASGNFPEYVDLSGSIEKQEKSRMHHRDIQIDGTAYESLKDAANALGITALAIMNRAASSNFPDCAIAGIEKTQKDEKLAVMAIPVTIDGVEYETQSAAARALEIDINTLKKRCASPAFPDYVCASIPKKAPKDGKPSLLRVEIDGISYRSVNAAYKALGVDRPIIKARCKSDDWPTWRM